MRKLALALLLLYAADDAFAQEIDEAIISPRFEYGLALMTSGVFNAYASGAVEGSYYYMLATNGYVTTNPASALPMGECRYYDTVDAQERRIGEQVVAYRGDNTYGFLQSSNPAFMRFRTVSPCFDGRFGEETEQQHRTFAYGAGSTVVSATKGKAYLTVNRTRIRKRPSSTSPYELFSNGAEWLSGDFDQIFIGAKDTLASAVSTASSTLCRGQLNPPASETCSPAFAWRLTPLVRITDNLVDPTDGKLKTFSALPPLLAEVNSFTESLPIFQGITARGALLFGFMEFGHICVTWDTQNPPHCTEGGLPIRLAAVYLTDTSSTVRPSAAKLYFKKGGSWIAMNGDGTFPTVPDDFASTLGIYTMSDVKFNPISSTWNAWTAEPPAPGVVVTTGCDDHVAGDINLVYVNLTNYAKTALWPSRNASGGRANPLGHYVFSPHCNCLREFIFYSSTDYACYNLGTSARGSEVVVRKTLDGPPNQ